VTSALSASGPPHPTGPGGGSSAVFKASSRLADASHRLSACAPVRDLIGAGDAQLAYQVQRFVNDARVREGAVIVGRKIGLTSLAVQQQLGVDRPDFGVLFEDMGYGDGSVLPMDRLLQPRVEAEVGFVLATDLADGDLGPVQVRAAVDHAVAALEVVDSRIRDWDITFGDTVADNGSSGLFVLGSRPVSLDEFSPVDCTMTMSFDGVEVSTGTGSACLGDPLLALAWLARTSRDLDQPLRAGEVILSGALGPMVPVNTGAEITADISGLGSVSCRLG